MQIIRTQAELRKVRATWGPVGFVPTMGALHPGHISLVHRAQADGLPVVASIFVNPIQFNQAADLAAYPIRTEEDLGMLEAAGAAAVFIPNAAEMYPQPVQIKLHFGPLEEVLEGAMRPGHFSGVGVVVSRLLHLVQPQKAYFGEKDLQQLAVIRRLVQDLGHEVEIVPCPTDREPDGLARSSRNLRLSPQGRRLAPHLHQILQRTWAEAHQLGIAQALSRGRQALADAEGFTPEYLEAVNPATFEVLSARPGIAAGPFALCTAAWLEDIRLIDNLVRWA